MSAVKDFKCNNCGAPLPLPKNSRGRVKCPSCKTECVIEGLVKNAEMAAKENINSGYPWIASTARLHKQLLAFLSESPNLPIDAFEKGEVVREEHHCVPAYLFYCNGTMSYTYEAGNIRQHKTAIDLGDRTRIETQNYMEWTQMSGTANASANVFASGNRTLASQINEMYMLLDPQKLVDYEELEFPHDIVTYDYNLPQAAAFNEHIKPYMERLLEEKARRSLAGKETANLTMGGCKIDKDEIVRVYLGLYRIVFKYDGEECAIWVRGDGKKAVYGEHLAEKQEARAKREKTVTAEKEKTIAGIEDVIAEKQKVIAEKQKIHDEKKQVLDSVPMNKTGLLVFLILVCATVAVITFLKGAAIGWWAGFSAGVILWAILLPSARKKGKVYDAQRVEPKKNFEEAEAALEAAKKELVEPQKKLEEARKDLEDAHEYLKKLLSLTIQQFKEKKKGLRGIYEAEVSGNADAF